MSAATEGSSGSGGHRGDIIELDRSDLDTEKTEAQINSDFISDFKDNTTESLEDLFYYALGSVGAVFLMILRLNLLKISIMQFMPML